MLLRAPAEAKGLRLSCSLGDNLPAGVIGDPFRLRQVLLNLLGNAVKFTATGSIELSLEQVGGDAKLARLRFRVRDTGIGMDVGTQARVFEKFTQGDSSTTRRYGGSGLGLNISQLLVRQMGGEIALHSMLGKGTEFSFELQFLLAAPLNNPAVTPAVSRQFHGHVLVVEDNVVNQRVIELMLRRAGLAVTVVDNGTDGIRRAVHEPWALILMDVQMPDIDGMEATRRIRRELAGRPLPVIALTANAMPEDRALCRAAGMDDFLTKPVHQTELYACLERWLPKPRNDA